MARSHAKVHAAVWDDPDWKALSAAAQRLYVLLLSQRRLSLIGRLDLLPSRWAKLAGDTTEADVIAALDELEHARFVAVDSDTDEVLVRTFVRHDVPDHPKNSNLVKGMWGAFEAIDSDYLRNVAVDNLPEWVWSYERVNPPEDAQNRRSRRSELAVRTSGSDWQSEPPSSFLLPPSTSILPPAAAPEPVVDDEPTASRDERRRVFDEAVELLTDAHMRRTTTKGNVTSHRKATRDGKARDHAHRARVLLDERPDLNGEGLARLLEPGALPNKPPEYVPEPHQGDRNLNLSGVANARPTRHLRSAS